MKNLAKVIQPESNPFLNFDLSTSKAITDYMFDFIGISNH